MRILLLLNCSFPPGAAAASRLEQYARGLREAGAEAFVFGVTREPREEVRDDWRLSATGVPYRVALLRAEREGSSRAILDQVRDAYLRAAAELGPWDAVLAYGQTFCYSNPVVEQCRRKGIPCLVECNEWLPWQGFKGFFLSPWYREKEAFRKFTVPRASGVIAISTLWENYLRRKGVAVIRIPALGEAEPTVSSCQLPVASCLWPGSAAKEMGNRKLEAGNRKPEEGSPPPSGPFGVCYLGLLARKNLPATLLESVRLAARRGLDVKLTVVGAEGRSWTELRRMVEREALLRGRVELTGFVPAAEVRARLAAAHALILLRPDTREARACFPTRLPEYLQTARPVILSAVDDFPLYFQHKVNAWLVPPGHQPQRVAEAYAELRGNPALAAAIGQHGRETGLREFSYRVHGARLLEFIGGLKV